MSKTDFLWELYGSCMDLRRLSLFLAVAENGSFTRAAKAMYAAQPAVSLAVKELERELGADLFYRLGRRVALTPAGSALIEPARQALRDVQTGAAAVAAVAGLAAGRLDICCLPTLAAHPTADLIGRFRHTYPAVAVDIAAADDPADLAELLRIGRCEVGVTEAAKVPGDLHQHVHGDQALFVLLPPGTAPTSRPVPLHDLDGTPWIATRTGTSTRRVIDEAFASAGWPRTSSSSPPYGTPSCPWSWPAPGPRWSPNPPPGRRRSSALSWPEPAQRSIERWCSPTGPEPSHLPPAPSSNSRRRLRATRIADSCPSCDGVASPESRHLPPGRRVGRSNIAARLSLTSQGRGR